MIRCPCGRSLCPDDAMNPSIPAATRTERLYALATELGWIELSAGSWSCPGCVRIAGRVRTGKLTSEVLS